MLGDAVGPFWRHRFAPFSMMPFAQPEDVLRRGWDSTDRTHLGLALISVMDCTLGMS